MTEGGVERLSPSEVDCLHTTRGGTSSHSPLDIPTRLDEYVRNIDNRMEAAKDHQRGKARTCNRKGDHWTSEIVHLLRESQMWWVRHKYCKSTKVALAFRIHCKFCSPALPGAIGLSMYLKMMTTSNCSGQRVSANISSCPS